MTPRRGGEADKIGNAYERVWTVNKMLDVLAGTFDSIAIEKGSAIGQGVEFILRRGDHAEVHQVKRQAGMYAKWTVGMLAAHGVWEDARRHVEAGRDYAFVSTVPAPAIKDLAERAHRVDSAAEWIDVHLSNADLERAIGELAAPGVLGDPQSAWDVLRHFRFAVYDHDEIQRTNETICNVLFSGGNGRLTASALETIASNHLGVTHTAAGLADLLYDFEISLATRVDSSQSSHAARTVRDQWLHSIGNELLEPPIPRAQLRETFTALDAAPTVFVIGHAGAGKSGVVYQLANAAIRADIPTLGFRLDRLQEFATTADLGNRLGLPGSPVAALGQIAEPGVSLLIVDQLDAVSLISGRAPRGFDVVADLVREAKAFPDMRVVLVCREFDLGNDERFRALAQREKAEKVTVSVLHPDEVGAALHSLGTDPDRLSPTQRELLRTPLNLTMYARTRGESDNRSWNDATDLLDAYWDRKRRDAEHRKPGVRFAAVIDRLAQAISTEGRLAVPEAVFDKDDLAGDAMVLVSEQVLTKDGRLIAFFHESFFDYAFARTWTARGETLLSLLTGGDQELFVRGQVRQILTYLRATDPARFLRELIEVLRSDDVRFHIKQNAIAVFVDIPDPGESDVALLRELLADPWTSRRAAPAITRPPWAVALDEAGVIVSWAASTDEDSLRWAGQAVLALAEVDPARALNQLGHLRGELLAWTVERALAVDAMLTSAPFQNLVLAGIRSGDLVFGLRSIWYRLSGKVNLAPDFSLKVLIAYLTEQPNAWSLNKSDQVALIDGNTDGLDDYITEIAQAIPQSYLAFVIPYLERVCDLTRMTEIHWQTIDRHFAWRRRPHPGRDQVDETLFDQTVAAFQRVARDDTVQTWLDNTLAEMASSDLATIQVLLYEALKANPERYATRARDLLLEGNGRLTSGYVDSSVWLSADLIRTMEPFLTDQDVQAIEGMVRDFRYPKEHRPQGYYAFTLLDAIPADRRTALGNRRYAEYQRTFGERPHEPRDVEGGFIGSPIVPERAARMSDQHWLRAMRTHAQGHERDWRTMTGGASELSQVLKTETAADPRRFAALALRFTPSMHSAYPAGVLLGLGEAPRVDQFEVIFEAVEHLSTFGDPAIDRWLGYAIRHYLDEVPLSTVARLVERAISSPDPATDGPQTSGRDDDAASVDNVMSFGMNTARGALADDLADLIVRDVGHSRTIAAMPAIAALVNDPFLGVRVFAARLAHAGMRDQPEICVAKALELLAEDPRSLAFRTVVWMTMGLGHRRPELTDDIITGALESADPDVRHHAGVLAGYAAAEWDIGKHLSAVLDSNDEQARAGLAALCAGRYRTAADNPIIRSTLLTLANDESELVRDAVADVVVQLRDQPLRQHSEFLLDLIQSPTFPVLASQLQITLETSLDRVDDLVCAAVDRLVNDEPDSLRDVRTARAADGHEFAELIIRGLAQSDSRTARSELLDALDDLLRVGAYGVEALVAGAER